MLCYYQILFTILRPKLAEVFEYFFLNLIDCRPH